MTADGGTSTAVGVTASAEEVAEGGAVAPGVGANDADPIPTRAELSYIAALRRRSVSLRRRLEQPMARAGVDPRGVHDAEALSAEIAHYLQHEPLRRWTTARRSRRDDRACRRTADRSRHESLRLWSPLTSPEETCGTTETRRSAPTAVDHSGACACWPSRHPGSSSAPSQAARGRLRHRGGRRWESVDSCPPRIGPPAGHREYCSQCPCRSARRHRLHDRVEGGTLMNARGGDAGIVWM